VSVVERAEPAESSVAVGARERLAWAVGIGAAWSVTYFGVASGADPGRARDLTTALDQHVPFVAASVWIYLGGIVCPALPLCVVRSRTLFRRTGIAYAAAILLSAVAFAAWPVSSAGLRADLASVSGADSLSAMALRTLYALDPPVNLCPSLHVAFGALAALAIMKAVPRLSLPAIVMVVLIAASVCTVKQHFVLDVAGGLLLAAAAAPLIVVEAQAPAATRMKPARSM